MSKRTLYTQDQLDEELKTYGEVLGESFCALVQGEVPMTPEQEMRDSVLQRALREKLKALLAEPDKPQFILYQMPAGQQSLITLTQDAQGECVVGYRDLDSRPPTKRIRNSIDEVVKEFNL